MTQDVEEAPLELAIVACASCDQLFLESPRRHTCPTCGGESSLTFFAFVANAEGIRLKEPGLTVVSLSPTPGVEAVRVEPPPEEPLPFEPTEVQAEFARLTFDDLMEAVLELLEGVAMDEAHLRQLFEELGAEAEAANAAVGRLVAVRDLLSRLRPQEIDDPVRAEAAPASLSETEAPAGEQGTPGPS